jgi:hypothetical protein
METLSLLIIATYRYNPLHVAICRGALQALQSTTPPEGGDVVSVASPCIVASRNGSGGSDD